MKNRTQRWYLLGLTALAVVLIALLALVAVDRTMRSSAMAETQSATQADAAILAAGLESDLEKFSLVPRVLATDPEVRALLNGDQDKRDVLNRRLEDLSQQTGAAALYLMNADGETLVASNWQRPESFVGSSYGFRNYFKQAIANGASDEFALGTVSRRPGLYIAQRVGDAATPRGVVVIKVEFDAIEKNWSDASQRAFVTDAEGIVLISSNPDWRFRTTRPGSAQARSSADDALRFGQSNLAPMPELSAGSGVAVEPLIEGTQTLSASNWELHLIADPSPAIQAAVATGRLFVLLGFVVIITALGLMLLWMRRREVKAEEIMAQRTSTLRDQLQQANRLATLGQVTAGVGHEIRQPVAAVRVFAENGEKLMAAGNTQAAKENFTKIVALTARIGKITEELLGFARRAAHPRKEMPLAQAIDGALLLLRDRIEREQVELVRPNPTLAQTRVRGEHVRLEQVLVNLLQNALDATPRGGIITISIMVDADACRLTVADTGTGIDDKIAETLFQPFATTKEAGIGLGLAISRDIMRSLDGDLVFESSTEGARFTMVIPRA